MPTIEVATLHDGTLTYLIDQAPFELPAVLGRDLACAWEQAGEAARRAIWSVGRVFRFQQPDGTTTDLALQDRDARCWAGAIDRAHGMQTGYGLALCLRLLALVELLSRAGWASELMTLAPDGATLHPALLRAAAAAPLTAEARFEESGFRARVCLPALPSPRTGAA